MTTANRRPGLSLTEVLVALFIMAIGAISILTLFPLAALNMAAALKDDRTTQAAYQSDGFIRSYWGSDVVEPTTDTDPATTPDPFTRAFADPNNDGTPDATAGQPSFPVVVDPMGVSAPWSAGTGGAADKVAGLASLPRRNLSPVTNNPVPKARTAMPAVQALRTCSLVDGLTFDPAQEGAAGTGTTVEREYRYNWLWVIQLPDAGDPTKATLSVVVFDKRTYLFNPPNAEVPLTPSPNGADVGRSTVQFPTGTNLQKGGWLMDATNYQEATTPPIFARNAHFYRIVSATDDGTTLNVELDRALEKDTKPDGAVDVPIGRADKRTFVALAGVAEVFTRRPLKP